MGLVAPVKGRERGISWPLHLRAYEAHRRLHGEEIVLLDFDGANCGGGFSAEELDRLVPGWRGEEEASLRV